MLAGNPLPPFCRLVWVAAEDNDELILVQVLGLLLQEPALRKPRKLAGPLKEAEELEQARVSVYPEGLIDLVLPRLLALLAWASLFIF